MSRVNTKNLSLADFDVGDLVITLNPESPHFLGSDIAAIAKATKTRLYIGGKIYDRKTGKRCAKANAKDRIRSLTRQEYRDHADDLGRYRKDKDKRLALDTTHLEIKLLMDEAMMPLRFHQQMNYLGEIIRFLEGLDAKFAK